MRLKLAGLICLAVWLGLMPLAQAQNCTGAEIVDTPKKLQLVLIKAKTILAGHINLKLSRPVLVQLADTETLDQLSEDSEYAGNTIGAFVPCGSKGICGTVYLLKEQACDEVLATLLHELTHAWQMENCPVQSPELAEGFARWVEYKGLQYAELYLLADRLLQVRDPWYGLGLHKWLELEDKIGISGCLQYARNRKDFDF